MEPIAHVFHADRLRSLVDGKTFARGEDYFRDGRVGELSRHGATVSARVTGSSPYDVKLWVKSGRIAYSCSCPVGSDGEFCKHCVAVSLAVLAAASPRSPDHASEDVDRTHDDLSADATMDTIDTIDTRDTRDEGPRRLLIVGDTALVGALEDFDDLRIDAGWSVDAAEAADLVAIVIGDGIALLALGLLATTGKLIVCCAPEHARIAAVDAVCRRHGIHLTHARGELHAAVRARLKSLGLG